MFKLKNVFFIILFCLVTQSVTGMVYELIPIKKPIDEQQKYYNSMSSRGQNKAVTKEKLNAKSYQENFFGYKVSDIRTNFEKLCPNDAQKLLSRMNKHLLLWHNVLCFLPKEITTKIITLMHHNNEKYAQLFCTRSMDSACKIYHDFIAKLKPEESIDPAYAWSEQKRDAMKRLSTTPWYYSNPVIKPEDSEIINNSGWAKQQFAGKKVTVLPENCCNARLHRQTICLMCGAGLCSAGIMMGCGAAVGACFPSCGCGGASCVLQRPFLTIVSLLSIVSCFGGFLYPTCLETDRCFRDSKHITM